MKAGEYIFEQIKKGNLDSVTGKALLEEIVPDDIAIVGISCEYSNVKDTAEFYQAVKHGMQGFKEFPESRVQYIPKDHEYLKKGAEHLKTTSEEFLERLCKEKGAYLEDIDTFDPEFFGISPEEAKYIDPTHRLVMKHSYLALEDAGIRLNEIRDSKTAIYIGKDKSITANYRSEIEEDSNYVNSGCWEGILASRLNYIYNLSGGSFVIDTACSSSLVAAHLAVKTLRDKEIDTAIVGGIALGLFPRQGSVIDQYSNVETPRSFMKVFDAESQGTIFGEGVGIVILKRLKNAIADNDNIYSIIRGSMINSDGKSNGLTAPNPHAQKDLLLETYERSRISPETVEYIDAHGTGTKLGDPIEVRGLTDAYKKYVDKKSFCALTSLKENIGHTVGAAGVGGLIKMSLALRNQEIFPNQSFEAPNEYIKFVDSPFYIPTKVRKWERGKYPRRGGISSFGFSGTNAHFILEEYEGRQEIEGEAVDYPFVFSAQSTGQLLAVLNKFVRHAQELKSHNLKNIAYTLIHKRNHFKTGVGFQARTFQEFMNNIQLAIGVLASGQSVEGIYHSDVKDITGDMKKLMQHRLKTGYDQYMANELIQLYLDGYDLALEAYPFEDTVTLSLPTYEFKQEVLWANVKKHNTYENSGPSLPVKSMLIRQQTLKTGHSDVYVVTLTPDDWFVDDHRIGGQRTFSGTTYTELAAELATLYFGTSAFVLEKLYFKSLIQLEDKRKAFQIHVNKTSSKQLEIEVFSYEHEDMNNYVTHATFTIRQAEPDATETLDVDAQFEQHLLKANFGSEENNFFKGRWDFAKQNFRLARPTSAEILLSLTLNEQYAQDLQDFYLHPSILDGILGAMVYERAQARGKSYLPLSYGKFTYTGKRFTPTVYSRTELLYDTDADHDVISANISVYNELGERIAFLDKYMMKAFANAYFKPYLHKVIWEPSTVRITQEADLVATATAGKTVLVVGNEKALEQAAAKRRTGVETVDYRTLKEFKPSEKYDFIIYAPWLGEALPQSGGVEGELLNYFDFAKTAHSLVKRKGKVLIVADNGFALEPQQTDINPLNYALLSSGRILGLENTGFKTQMINLPLFDLDLILAMAGEDELDGKQLLYDNHQLYQETLTEVKELVDAPPLQLTEEDCVIVTGGYGGIGLEYIDLLLDLKPLLHIAILGRTDTGLVLSAKEQLTPEENVKLNKINKIKLKGPNVHFYSCDVAREEDVKRVVGGLVETRTVAGVVHLAGVPEEGMLFTKSAEEFMGIVAPKVIGTMLLRKYLTAQALRFFIASSSMTTITGSAGQFSYTLGNAFLEGYTDEATSTVLWPGWKETGMALQFGDLATADEHLLMKSLTTAIGREYIKLSLEKKVGRIIAGEFNKAKIAEYLGDYISLPQQFTGAAAPLVPGSIADEAAKVQIKDYSTLTISGTERQDDVEKFVTVVFASVLDRNDIDVNKSFTDLGGDSLKAFGIYGPIAEQFKVDIEVADVFIYPTVTQLSQYVRELLEEEANE